MIKNNYIFNFELRGRHTEIEILQPPLDLSCSLDIYPKSYVLIHSDAFKKQNFADISSNLLIFLLTPSLRGLSS